MEMPSLECLWSIQSELCTRQLGRLACILGEKSELEIRLGNHHCITDPEEQRGKSREKGRVSRSRARREEEGVCKRKPVGTMRTRDSEKCNQENKGMEHFKKGVWDKSVGPGCPCSPVHCLTSIRAELPGQKPEGVSSGLKRWKQACVRSKHWGMRMGGGGAPSPFPRGVGGAGPGQRLRPQEGWEEKQGEEGSKERC